MNKTLDNIPIATPIYPKENTPLINKTIKCDKCKLSFSLTTSYSSKEKIYYYCPKCQINRCRTCLKPFYLTHNISPYTADFYRCEDCLLSSPKSIINSCLIS